MRAALWLRLRESRRRGGPLLLAGGSLAVLAVALWGGDTVDGRYGLASDLAAVLAYLGAVFLGAFPIAVDRERKRSYLPGASPVAPWSWALGNALGAALAAGICALAFFAAAGLGTALAGGIETHAVTRIGGRGIVYLPEGAESLTITRVPDDGRKLRLEVRTYLVAEEAVGTPDAATVEVDGVRHDVYPEQTVVVPVTPPTIELRNLTPAFAVGILPEKARVLGAGRPFLANAVQGGVAPALGAAAAAAAGAAAGAHLGSAVAALLTTLLVLLAGMKGFLLESFEAEARLAAEAHEHAGHDHAHHHPPGGGESALRDAAQALVKGALAVLPDLAELDETGSVALGEWLERRQAARALLVAAAALVLAAAAGGLGVHLRRTP